MKKVLFVLISILILFCIGFIVAITSNPEDTNLDSIFIKAHINSDSSVDIVEDWNLSYEYVPKYYRYVKLHKNSEITSLNVKDGLGQLYEYVPSWDSVASVERDYKTSMEKITPETTKLLWGIGYDEKVYEDIYNNVDELSKLYLFSNYNKRSYTIQYKINNFVKNVDDGQIIQWNFFDTFSNLRPNKLKLEISSDKPFENNHQIWNNRNMSSYIKDGKIYIETKDELKGTENLFFVSSFKPNTFNSNIILSGTKDSWLDETKREAFSFWLEKTLTKTVEILKNIIILFGLIFSFIFFKLYMSAPTSSQSNTLGIKHKKINEKKVSYFREIPCDNLYRAYFIVRLYNLNEEDSNFFGAVLLKWLHENKISIIDNDIDLKPSEAKNFDNHYESRLYKLLCDINRSSILSKKEFQDWCRSNYYQITTWYERVLAEEKGVLIRDGSLILKKTKRGIINQVCEVSQSFHDEAIKLAGLKKFLLEFSEIEDKEAIEVNLWEEYLIYAQMFGIADKVDNTLNDLYPTIFSMFDPRDLFIEDDTSPFLK